MNGIDGWKEFKTGVSLANSGGAIDVQLISSELKARIKTYVILID
jgi:hypothetical protein